MLTKLLKRLGIVKESKPLYKAAELYAKPYLQARIPFTDADGILNVDISYAPSGASGSYVKINDILGVKVLRYSRQPKKPDSVFDFRDVVDTNNGGDCYTNLDNEFHCQLEVSRRTQFTSKPFQLVIVKVIREGAFYGYCIGMTMQHIEGRMLSSMHGLDEYEIRKQVIDRMRKFGVTLRDCHGNNIMVNNQGQFIPIDFDPHFVNLHSIEETQAA